MSETKKVISPALSRIDADNYSFTRDGNGLPSRRVTMSSGEMGTLLQGVKYDFIGASYPTTTTEVYEYRDGGSGGTLNATVTVTYTDTTKDCISSVERS